MGHQFLYKFILPLQLIFHLTATFICAFGHHPTAFEIPLPPSLGRIFNPNVQQRFPTVTLPSQRHGTQCLIDYVQERHTITSSSLLSSIRSNLTVEQFPRDQCDFCEPYNFPEATVDHSLPISFNANSIIGMDLVKSGPNYGWGTRKTSFASVWVKDGDGQLIINGRNGAEFLQNNVFWICAIVEPLAKVRMQETCDVIAQARGGGLSGKAGAIRLAVARILANLHSHLRKTLKDAGFLTVDRRRVERKKFGLKKARKAPQYHKR